MKKETIIAIVLGIVAGIGIAGAVIYNSKQASQENADVILDNVSPTPQVDTSELAPLLLTAPDNEAVLDTSTVTLEGSSQKGALVVVQSLTGEKVLNLEEKDFRVDVTLVPGENNIRVTAYNDRNIDSRSLTLYYVNEE